MNPQPTVSIILLAWNSADYLPRCLDSLSTQTFQDFEIIIVDNGSQDGCAIGLEEKYPNLNLRVERLDSNLGFTVANNIGAKLARGGWIALLNTDAFPEPNWLETLLEATRIHPNAFFTSRQVQANAPNMLDGEGDIYHVSGLAWRKSYNLPVYPLNEIQEVFSACGAAALFPREEFLSAGGFDEDFLSYHEDVDLGFRLRMRGLRCMLVPQAIVSHVGSVTFGKKSDFSIYYGHRNLVWTYAKDMPAILLWFYLPLHILVTIFFIFYFTVKGRGGVILRAKWDALRGLPLMFKKRRAIQSGRKIPIAQLHRTMSRNWMTPFTEFIKRNTDRS
ncbi:MAG: glycosyltransferase family 2 protein [Chloroflexi bacterium]|nr:glycosyltransferase family 2 protein [Chloroflexota bacterium]